MSILIQIYAGEGNLKIISDNVWQALIDANSPPVLFRNGDRVVWIEDDDHGIPVMRPVTETRLVHHTVRRCRFWKYRNGEAISARPPQDLAGDILARPDKSALPVLRGVSGVPLFGPDGSLHSTPGFCEATGFYYAPRGLNDLYPVNPNPADWEIEEAKNIILKEFLGDFPFTGPAELAHAVAALEQPLVRLMIDGPTPLYLIEKPTAGTGATLLANVICYPALGRFPSAVTQPKHESEWRYSLLSWLRDYPTVIMIDNLGSRLESAALASAVTDVKFCDRIIRTSNALSVPVSCMWLATGNNPVLSSEIARRTVRIRLDAGTEHPDLRSKFRNSDLRRWTVENRRELLWAMLTLVQAWIVAGQPGGGVSMGGFERWSHVMGGILKVAGIEGFLTNRNAVRTFADSETGRAMPFLCSWWGRFGDAPVGVNDLFDLAHDLDLGTANEHSQRIKLGYYLDSLRDRRFGDYRVEKLGQYQGSQRYCLRWVLVGEDQ